MIVFILYQIVHVSKLIALKIQILSMVYLVIQLYVPLGRYCYMYIYKYIYIVNIYHSHLSSPISYKIQRCRGSPDQMKSWICIFTFLILQYMHKKGVNTDMYTFQCDIKKKKKKKKETNRKETHTHRKYFSIFRIGK